MPRRISAIALLYGLAVGSFVGLLVTLAGTAVFAFSGAVPVSNVAEAGALVSQDPRFVAVALLGALAGAYAAGDLATTLTPGDELLHALVVGILMVATFAMLPRQILLGAYPAWYTLGVLVLTIPLSLMGGLHRRGLATT